VNQRHLAGAVAGSLVAGLGLTVMLMAGERKSGTPSELAALERTAAQKLGVSSPSPEALPSAREQAVIQGGHLALSVLAGAGYAAVTDEKTPVLAGGIGFGLAFYAVAHWLVGPLLGLKRPEWQSGRSTIGMHALNHIGFGLVTALGARTLARNQPE
jgi:hypothetical protein